MGKKGIRSQKGQSESDWGQPKTKRLTVQLTEEGYEAVKKRAESFGISITEVFERWGRGFSLDSESELPKPKRTQIPTVESILSALPRYSRQHVLRIVKAGLDLLIGSLPPDSNDDPQDHIQGALDDNQPTPMPETFSDLVKENYFELTYSGKVKPDRVRALALGEMPTTAELAIIAHVLDVMEEFIVELRDRSFPKKPKPKQTNGTT
jgi:hypothetical protein